MATIVPAILESTRTDVVQKLLHAKDFAKEVQVDIVDGSFAGHFTWPYAEDLMTSSEILPALPHTDELCMELDLMVDDPERTLKTWMNLGARRMLFHLESTTHMKLLLETLTNEYGYDKGFMSDTLSVGIAINYNTHVELLEPYLDSIDYVQFMGIQRIGKQGQPLVSDVLTKIKMFTHTHPDMPVQVDGGVTLANAPELLSLGVSRLVVGSAIWNTDNPSRSYQQFKALGEQYGLYE